MMTYEQYLMSKLAEEATELAQRALKLQQYGAQEREVGTDRTNADRLRDEWIDVLATIRMAKEAGTLTMPDTAEVDAAIARKVAKINRYLALSRDLGQVATLRLRGGQVSSNAIGTLEYIGGRGAYRAGEGIDTNPLVEGSIAWDEWRSGWQSAEAEANP